MIRTYAEAAAQFPWLFEAAAFVLGACIGSFLNVVIYRVPAGRSVVRPGSACACGKPIPWHDNIPILSWIILRGRARCCGRPFSIRYPAIELLTAVLFLIAWLRLGPAAALCGWVFLGSLIAGTFIDLDHMIIPDAFTLWLAVEGLVLSSLVPSLHAEASGFYFLDCIRSGTDALIGIVAGSGVVLWIALIAEAVLRKEAMGFGDVKFVGAIGAFCGWRGAVFSVFGGAAVGTVWLGTALIWAKVAGSRAAGTPRTETPDGKPAELGLGVHVPFGPMLAIAGALYFLFLRERVDAWFGELTVLF